MPAATMGTHDRSVGQDVGTGGSGSPATPVGHALSVLCVVVLACALVPSVSVADTPMVAARTALRLTNDRLALMKQVMASKWVSRSPIQDRAQEQVVLAGALALGRRQGLADAGVRRFFEQQIIAAKEVQLGWGERWLWYGFPPGLEPPDLTRLRAQLAALTPKLIGALAGLGRLRCEPGVRATLLRASRRLIDTRFVTARRRAAIVTALLSVRRAGSSCSSSPR